MPDVELPDDLAYSADHEWLRVDGGTARVGITAFAQDALGDIVFATGPEPGTEVTAGQACGEIESTKSVSEIYAPISGTVAARNTALDDAPELINTDPYGAGWLFEITLADPDRTAEERSRLLTAAQYRAGLES